MKKIILSSLFSLGFICLVSAQEQKPAKTMKNNETEKPIESSKEIVTGKKIDRNRPITKAKTKEAVLAKPQN